ncbi:hypothetical protein [Atopobium sp. oral taxon 810]|uniref:hypothetical protein n=1 Tax=Atopobium sp. oral taxon 810 TaxID=712158 RepID=UPI0005537839
MKCIVEELKSEGVVDNMGVINSRCEKVILEEVEQQVALPASSDACYDLYHAVAHVHHEVVEVTCRA